MSSRSSSRHAYNFMCFTADGGRYGCFLAASKLKEADMRRVDWHLDRGGVLYVISHYLAGIYISSPSLHIKMLFLLCTIQTKSVVLTLSASWYSISQLKEAEFCANRRLNRGSLFHVSWKSSVVAFVDAAYCTYIFEIAATSDTRCHIRKLLMMQHIHNDKWDSILCCVLYIMVAQGGQHVYRMTSQSRKLVSLSPKATCCAFRGGRLLYILWQAKKFNFATSKVKKQILI